MVKLPHFPAPPPVRFHRRLTVFLLAMSCVVLQARALPAQAVLRLAPFPRRGGSNVAAGQAAMVHVTDRRLTQRLLRARDLLKMGESRAAISLLQSLLEHGEDSFFQEPGADGSENPAASFVSLKQAVSILLGKLGAEGQRIYELEYGTTARQLLKRARVEGGSGLLEQAARKYFHTKAGQEAAYALGNLYLDRGQALMAAMRFEQLRNSGVTDFEPLLSVKAALAWARLGQTARSTRVLLAMKPAVRQSLVQRGGPLADALRTPQSTRQWLAGLAEAAEGTADLDWRSWMVWRGNRNRSATAAAAVPGHEPDWVFPTFQRGLEEPRRQQQLRKSRDELTRLERAERARDGLVLPAVDPLVIGDVAVFRSLFDIKAVDLSTGRHLWDAVTLDPAFDRVLDGNVPSYSVRGRSERQSLTSLFLGQRAWHDRTIGTLSTDGRFIYAVDEVGVLGLQTFSSRGLVQSGAVADWVPRDFNRLLAFELASEGKLVWELGGPRGEQALELGGTFFLGPPLPLGETLYCLCERDGEIRLLALSGRSVVGAQGTGGTMLWSQGIAEPEFNVLTHPGRRLAGLSPSYAEGVLVCPTEAGLVVAVDLARRQLLWSYPYRTASSRLTNSRQQAIQMRVLMARGLAKLPKTEGWFDPIPIVAEGCVVLTPRDSNALHCLSLEDGRRLWTRPRGQGHFVAAVYKGQVIVVERSRVQAFRLTDGAVAWSMPTVIPRPTGVGVRVGHLYHLPVATHDRVAVASGSQPETVSASSSQQGAIITLDLETGRLLARTEMAGGRLVGNLVGGGGRLLGLAHDELVSFEDDQVLQQRIASRLKIDPKDASALALRGRRRLHRGEFEPAVADLAASYQTRADSRVRRLLVQALLDGLHFDYVRYAAQADRLEGLLESPDEQLAFRRLRAGGLAESGQVVDAFDEYLKLKADRPAAKPVGVSRLESIDQDLSVLRDRWIASRLAAVDRKATPAQQQALSARRETLLARARSAAGTVALEELVVLFDGQSVADRSRRLILDRLPADAVAVRRERLLLALRASNDLPTSGRATAELVTLWAHQKKITAVGQLVEELRSGRLADVAVGGGRTGKSQVAAWQTDPQMKTILQPEPDWKTGQVLAVRTVNEERRTSVNTYPVPFSGPRPIAWHGWTFRLDNRRQYVVAYDDQGLERWRLTTVGDLAVPRSEAKVPYAFEGNYVRAAGHLLLVVLGNRFAVVDGLGDNQHPHVLWTRNLFEGKTGIQPRIIRLNGARPGRPGWFKMTDPSGRPIGHVGTFGSGLVSYQVGTALQAADPLNGQVLWNRSGLPRGSRIHGADGFVFVEPTDRNEVLVLDAADGAAVATRTLPTRGEIIARMGRFVVTRRILDQKQIVAALDLVSGQTPFTMEVRGDLLPVAAENGDLAVLELGGRFVLVNPATGQRRIDAPLGPLDDCSGFHLLETPERFLLMVNRPSNVRVRGTSNRAIPVHGRAWAFAKAVDRTAGPILRPAWGPVTIEHQAIELDQPQHLPVLTFVSRVYRPVQNVLNPRPRTEYGVLVLDQRSGRIVHRESGTLPVSAMRARSDRQRQQITLEFYRSTVELTFTDRPADPATGG